jgi:hypothetical protein
MKTVLFLILSILTINLVAQKEDNFGDKGPLQKIIVGYFTKQLSLTETESKEFWPLYTEFRKEMQKAAKDAANDEIKRNEAVLVVQKKYKPKFQAILKTEERTNKVFVLHRTLAQELKRKIKERRVKRNQGNTV